MQNQLLDSKIDLDNTENYILSIRLIPDGFSFSMYNPFVEESFSYREIKFPMENNYVYNLEEIILENPFFILPYKAVHIISATDKFSYIPESLYNEHHAEMFYNFCLEKSEEVILIDKLQKNQLRSIYSMNNKLFTYLLRTFINPVFHHHLSSLSEYFHEKSKSGNCNKMFVHIQNNVVDVISYGTHGLLISTSFHFKELNDACYYLLNAWNHLGFDQCRDELSICGNSLLRDEISHLLKRYINLVSPVLFPSQMHDLGIESMDTPFDLITLPLCEL